MPDKRLIDANALKDRISDVASSAHHDVMSVKNVLELIDTARAVDAVPVLHARWVQEDEDAWRCTCCGALWIFIDGGPEENDARFCPVCGAKMDGGATDGSDA
jgi:rubrerythrin